MRAEGSSLCISITLITRACSKNSGPIVLRASNLHHLRFIPLKSRAVNLPACFNRWVRRQVLAGDWSWLCPCSVHLQRPSLIDSWAAIHWTHTICCQPFADPTHSREQKSSTCLNKLLVFRDRDKEEENEPATCIYLLLGEGARQVKGGWEQQQKVREWEWRLMLAGKCA